MLTDIRYALRLLRRSPGFTAAAVFTLALGIGANTAIYSVLQAVWIDAVPFRDPGRLVVVSSASDEWQNMAVSEGDFNDWRARSQSLVDLTAVGGRGLSARIPEVPRNLIAAHTSPSLFSLLEAQPAAGRLLTSQDEQPDAPAVAVLSYESWQRDLGGDPAALGRPVTLTRAGGTYTATIVGIAPPNFRILNFAPAVWVPREAVFAQDRGSRGATIVARLRDGASLGQARDEMNRIAADLAREHPASNASFPRANVVSIRERVAGQGVGESLFLLLAATGIILIMACANVANLLLARGRRRQDEMAIRAALGAARGRLVRQVLVESAVVAFAGCALGLLATLWARDILVGVMPRSLPRTDAIAIDARVLFFAGGLASVAAFAAGLLPAFRTSLATPGSRALARMNTEAGGRRLSAALVAGQVSLAVTVLAAAGLLVGSLIRLAGTDPGFNPQHVLVFDIRAIGSSGDQRSGDERRQAVMDVLRQIPQVEHAGFTEGLPLGGSRATYSLRLPDGPATDLPQIDVRTASPEYFAAMGIPRLSGRDFADGDRQGAPGVAIVNDLAARRVWGQRSPLGQRLSIGGHDLEVVGVVGSVRHEGLDALPVPELYRPAAQGGGGGVTYVARTSVAPASVMRTIQSAIETGAGVEVRDLRTLDEHVLHSIHVPRFRAFLFGVMGLLVVVLTTVGVFSVTAHGVVQRHRELGIRLALGASGRQLVSLVTTQAAWPVLVGLAIGLVAAYNTNHLVAHFLYGTTPTDPVMMAAVSVGVLGLALLAAYIPARRTLGIDPVEVLRSE
jgi:putative ABC transport system permease protein